MGRYLILPYSYRYGIYSDYGADRDRMQSRSRKYGSPQALTPRLVVFIFIELKEGLSRKIGIYCRCDL